ncbi:MAG TPA: hypothetical protein VLQ79_10735 [Myxococcaceae bacterium]|nr:hypothetical protein [Myxococcaceae bacterium]
MMVLLWMACAAAGQSDRPAAPAPPPSTAMINTLGFDQAVQMGSDYVQKAAGPGKPTLLSSQELQAGLVLLTFDMGPGKFPVRVTVDRLNGRVTSMEPVEQVPGVTQPAK